MKTIYVDSDFKCHVTNDGTMTPIETDYFENKCDAYIEGYCCEDGKFYPWKDHDELETAQEEQNVANIEALKIMGVIV